jgi:hypothetical protein
MQSRGSLRSGGGLLATGGALHESEQMRLQKEVDTFTQKLEHEKRRLLIIEEQIKQVTEELLERDRSVK